MSELESILNYLETTSMEPHDDYTSEFSYKEQKVLWKYIKELQQKNQKYKEAIDKINVFLDNHDKNADKLYYKYDNKYLLSEIKEDIRDILKEAEDK